jgi:hypothetical protein
VTSTNAPTTTSGKGEDCDKAHAHHANDERYSSRIVVHIAPSCHVLRPAAVKRKNIQIGWIAKIFAHSGVLLLNTTMRSHSPSYRVIFTIEPVEACIDI